MQSDFSLTINYLNKKIVGGGGGGDIFTFDRVFAFFMLTNRGRNIVIITIRSTFHTFGILIFFFFLIISGKI